MARSTQSAYKAYDEYLLKQLVNSTIEDVSLKEQVGYDAILGALNRRLDVSINWDAIWGWQSDLLGHTGTIVNLRFADDASTLYSAAQDGTLRQWHIQAMNATSDQCTHAWDILFKPFAKTQTPGRGTFILRVFLHDFQPKQNTDSSIPWRAGCWLQRRDTRELRFDLRYDRNCRVFEPGDVCNRRRALADRRHEDRKLDDHLRIGR